MSEGTTEPMVIGIKGTLPHTQQILHYTCVPHCLWMVIEKIKLTIPQNNIKFWTVQEIVDIVKSNPHLATSYENIKFINEELKKYSPILEFEPNYNFKWNDIVSELKENRPVIAYLKNNAQYRVAHAVIVTNYNKEKDEVTYNDPKHGKKTIYIADFMGYWDNAANVLYPVKVGKVIQTHIDDITEGRVSDE